MPDVNVYVNKLCATLLIETFSTSSTVPVAPVPLRVIVSLIWKLPPLAGAV